MKQSTLLRPACLFLLFILCFSHTTYGQSTPKGLCTDQETLPASTLILFENTEKISSEDSEGKTVSFRVRGNVTVKGKVLIRDGAVAIGRIKRIRPAGYNFTAQIVVIITHVRTADDQTIAVAGDEQTFTGKYTRQGFNVEQGQKFTATVMNNTMVVPSK